MMAKYIDITFPYHSLAEILESLSICGVKEVIMTNEDNKLKIRLNVDELSKLNYYKKNPKKEDSLCENIKEQALLNDVNPLLVAKFKEHFMNDSSTDWETFNELKNWKGGKGEHMLLKDVLSFIPDKQKVILVYTHRAKGKKDASKYELQYNETIFQGLKEIAADFILEEYSLERVYEIKTTDNVTTICFDD